MQEKTTIFSYILPLESFYYHRKKKKKKKKQKLESCSQGLIWNFENLKDFAEYDVSRLDVLK